MKSELLPETIRQVPDHMLAMLGLVPSLSARPSVYLERNGRGESYYSLRYYAPRVGERPGSQLSIYIGHLTEDDAILLQEWITMTWYAQRLFPNSTDPAPCIRGLLNSRRKYRKLAAEAAKRCGYSLHGYQLRRTRMAATVGSTRNPSSCQTSVGPTESRNVEQKALGDLKFYLSMAYDDNVALRAAQQDYIHYVIMRRSPRPKIDSSGELSTSLQRCIRSLLRTERTREDLKRSADIAERAYKQKERAR